MGSGVSVEQGIKDAKAEVDSNPVTDEVYFSSFVSFS